MSRIVRNISASTNPRLTKREVECLRWVAQGKTTHEISRILDLSEHGVVHHVRSVMRKLGVSNRHFAANVATKLGLLN